MPCNKDLYECCVHFKEAAVEFVSVEQAPAVWRPEHRQADPFQTLEKHSDHHSAAINSSIYLFNRSWDVKESGGKNKKRQKRRNTSSGSIQDISVYMYDSFQNVLKQDYLDRLHPK